MPYRVVDSAFNRSNYPKLIGQVFDQPPSYVNVEPTIPEDTVGVRILKALVEHSINGITMEQMNRIVRRLDRMTKLDRGFPSRVAEVLMDELGAQTALTWLDKSLAAGKIKVREWEEMRAILLFKIPRAEIEQSEVARAAQALIAGQRRLKEDFERLTGTGQLAFRKPVEALSADVKKIRKAWGV